MIRNIFNTLSTFDWSLFHFLRPKALWLFVLLAVVIVILLLGNREQSKWKRIITPALRPFMFSRGSYSAIVLPLILMSVGLSCMIVALAGPTWKKRDIPGEKIPAVVMITLDLSKSMLATDIQPSRLERAKLKIVDFLDTNPRARAGLMAFAGTPHSVLPFTSDYKLVKHHAASLQNWEMPVQGTDFGLMVNLLDTMMARVKAPSTILLLTDAISDSQASTLADFINNSIHRMEILLFSTPDGAPVPGVPGVVSKPSPTALNNLRQNEKINITTITLDKSDVEGIAERISEKLVFEKDKKTDAKEWDDVGWLLLIPTLIIVAFSFRKGWVVQWCWLPLLLLSVTSCGTNSKHPNWWYTPDYQGQMWEKKSNYLKAADHYQDDTHKAAAYFKAGDYQSAAELFGMDTTATGQYNYGLALAKLGDYDGAMDAFQQAGSLDASLKERAQKSIDATKLIKDEAKSVMRFQPHESSIDSVLKNTEKGKLKERKPKTEDEQLSSDTEVKKLPTKGDRMSDEVQSDIHRAKEQKFPPKDFKMDPPVPMETKVLMQKTNADPGEFLHRRFEIQKQRYYPDVKQGKNIE